MYIGVDVK